MAKKCHNYYNPDFLFFSGFFRVFGPYRPRFWAYIKPIDLLFGPIWSFQCLKGGMRSHRRRGADLESFSRPSSPRSTALYLAMEIIGNHRK